MSLAETPFEQKPGQRGSLTQAALGTDPEKWATEFIKRNPEVAGLGLTGMQGGLLCTWFEAGWWNLLGGREGINNHFEIEFALGGEDNMVQWGLVLPFLGRVAVGVRVPRRWTKGWLYERREWTLRIGYIGRWLEVLIGSDEHMRDTGMVDYYKRKQEHPDCVCGHDPRWHEPVVKVTPGSAKTIADFDRLAKYIQNETGRCITPAEINHGSTPCECTGYKKKPPTWSRAALHPGWHFTFAPRPRDFLLGRKDCILTEGEPTEVQVPMPEGMYTGMLKREDRVWQRKRWPWPSQKSTDYWLSMTVGPPTPGKGENSWDIEDDAIMGCGGKTPEEAISNVVKAALRNRRRYASEKWVPAEGWPVSR